MRGIALLSMAALVSCFGEPPGRCNIDDDCGEGLKCGPTGVCSTRVEPPVTCTPACTAEQVCAGTKCWSQSEITASIELPVQHSWVRGETAARVRFGPAGSPLMPNVAALLIAQEGSSTELALAAADSTRVIWGAAWNTRSYKDGQALLGVTATLGTTTWTWDIGYEVKVDNTPPVIVPKAQAELIYRAGVSFRASATVNDLAVASVRADVQAVPTVASDLNLTQDGATYQTDLLDVKAFQFLAGAGHYTIRWTASDLAGNLASKDYLQLVTRNRWDRPLKLTSSTTKALSAPLLLGDRVVAGGKDGDNPALMLTTTDGEVRWRSSPDPGAGLSAAIVGDADSGIWVVFEDGDVRRLVDEGSSEAVNCLFEAINTKVLGSLAVVSFSRNHWAVAAADDGVLYVLPRRAASGCTAMLKSSDVGLDFNDFQGSSPAIIAESASNLQLFVTSRSTGNGLLSRLGVDVLLEQWFSPPTSYVVGGASGVGSPSLFDGATDFAYAGFDASVRFVESQTDALPQRGSIPTSAGSLTLEIAIDDRRNSYVAAANALIAVDDAGNELWRSDAVVPSATPVLGAGRLVYVATAAGKLHVLDADDGGEIWFLDLGSPLVGAPTLDCDGTLYVGADNGNLYAIQTDSPGLWPGAKWPKARHDIRNTGWTGASIICP